MSTPFWSPSGKVAWVESDGPNASTIKQKDLLAGTSQSCTIANNEGDIFLAGNLGNDWIAYIDLHTNWSDVNRTLNVINMSSCESAFGNPFIDEELEGYPEDYGPSYAAVGGEWVAWTKGVTIFLWNSSSGSRFSVGSVGSTWDLKWDLEGKKLLIVQTAQGESHRDVWLYERPTSPTTDNSRLVRLTNDADEEDRVAWLNDGRALILKGNKVYAYDPRAGTEAEQVDISALGLTPSYPVLQFQAHGDTVMIVGMQDAMPRTQSFVWTMWMAVKPYVSTPVWDLTDNHFSVRAGETLRLNLGEHVTDPDGHALAFSDNSSLFEIDARTGWINYTAAAADRGTYVMMIEADDGFGHSSSQSIVVDVSANRAPSFNLPTAPYAVRIGDELQILLAGYAEDADGDRLSYSTTWDASSMVRVGNDTGIAVIAPHSTDRGEYLVTFCVDDGRVRICDYALISVTAAPSTPPPSTGGTAPPASTFLYLGVLLLLVFGAVAVLGILLPSRTGPVSEARPATHCPHCNSKIPAGSKACPACRGNPDLPPDETRIY